MSPWSPLALLPVIALAAPTTPHARGIETPGYAWNAPSTEKLAALKKRGDPERGAEEFAICAGCHMKKGEGRADGTFPRLAGQHASFIIKQLTDIRLGIRDNPVMYPYAATLTSPQELADLAAFLAALPVPQDNGRGDGMHVDRGRALYERDCASCHGAHGEGDASRFYPQVARQHFKYLVRQTAETRSGRRRNANPEMVRVLRNYTEAQVEEVCDYLSRL